jgi:hypothetical protein
VATVIQDQQRSNDDRPPRWDRTQRAALFDQYRDLQAKGSPCVKPPRRLMCPVARSRHGGRIRKVLTALITVRVTWAPSGLPRGSPWWTERRWR